MPKVSVIVPVYKAEQYLHRCVDSILSQSFTDWECILVDDGSPDQSGEICDAYATKDSRVRVFHKENGGVSSARQCGMDHAIGEYTIHADPDDWVEPNMLEELYRKAKEEDADMVICDFINEYKGGKQRYMKQQPESLDSRAVLRQLLFQQLHGSCWNKLVRRACYKEWGIRFPSNANLWEDHWVSCLLCYHNIRITYLNKAYYHYDCATNPHSIVRHIKKCYVEDQIRFCRYFSQLLKEDEELYASLSQSKISTKNLMFTSMFYKPMEIVNLFPEVNERIIREYGIKLDIRDIVPFCVSLIIRSERLYIPTKWLYIVVNKWLNPLLICLRDKKLMSLLSEEIQYFLVVLV